MPYRRHFSNSYGSHRSVAEIQASRSQRARKIDANLKAPIAKSEEQWINEPNRYDLPNIDTPKTKSDTTKEFRVLSERDLLFKVWVEQRDFRRAQPESKWTDKDREFMKMTFDQYLETQKEEDVSQIRPSTQRVSAGVMDISTLPRVHEQEEGNVKMAFENETGEHRVSYVEIGQGRYEIRVLTPTDRYAIPSDRANLTEEDVRRALRNTSSTRGDIPKPFFEGPKISGSTATYNKATGWLSITFDSIPSVETRNELKSQGFRYVPYDKRWRVTYTPDREAKLKKMSGSVEQIDIKPNWAAKAEHAADMAVKHVEKSNEAYERSSKIADAIPFGQPILVGHHSEKHHRADLERIQNAMDKSVEERKIAETYQERAERYGRKATGENPVTIFNRIKKLEADKRKMEKQLAIAESGQDTIYYSGHLSEGRKAEIKQWITHYDQRLEVEREKYKASGGIPTDSLTIKPGDKVQTRWGPATINTVSQKTVRVAFDDPRTSMYGPSNNSILDKTDIRGKL